MARVSLSVVVGPDGRDHDIQVLDGLGLGLNEKAIEAVQQWRFSPGKKAGVPANVRAQIHIMFRFL